MGKTYLRYEPEATFGIIHSPEGSMALDKSGDAAFCSALRDVIVWNLKTGSVVDSFVGNGDFGGHITSICTNFRQQLVAAGYSSGGVHVWEIRSKKLKVSFNGHKTAITSLCFDVEGTRLVSGSKDTNIVVWDVVGEVGLFRLKGHTDAITACWINFERGQLYSVSKDTLLKIWDVPSQSCIHTCVGHRCEIWAAEHFESGRYILTGSGDGQLRLYEVEGREESPLDLVGQVTRTDRSRIDCLRCDLSRSFVVCQSRSKVVELYRLRGPEEVLQRRKRRMKRQRTKQRKKGEAEESEVAELPPKCGGLRCADLMRFRREADDVVMLVSLMRLKHKPCSVDVRFAGAESTSVIVSVAYKSNMIEDFVIDVDHEKAKVGAAPFRKVHTVAQPGHRGDIRCIALSLDDSLALTCSGTASKVWSTHSRACLHTFDTGYGVCCKIVPGNRHGIVTTKTGDVHFIELSTGIVSETLEKAHQGAVWGLDVRPDKRGFVTVGADKNMHFWDFSLKKVGAGQCLTAVRNRTLKMAEECLAVRYSHAKDSTKLLVAVSLLDNTIKVFFDDSLKFFLSLYGHRLPVVCLDISDDDTLLVSGSADKNIKIWGLDFGDCHKSIFAHSDTITSLAFVRKTHYFFSSAKDGVVKYWDADLFEQILSLEGHHNQIWSVVSSALGEFIMSVGADRGLRVWKRTEDIVFLDEEKEKRLEAILDKESGDVEEADRRAGGGESGKASLTTLETMRAAETLLEALETAEEELKTLKEHKEEAADAERALSEEQRAERGALRAAGKPVPALVKAPESNPILLGASPHRHVLNVLRRIRAAEVEGVLLSMPFRHAVLLLEMVGKCGCETDAAQFSVYLHRGWHIELVSKCLFLLIKIHHGQLVATRSCREMLMELRALAHERIGRHKDDIGFNLAGLRFLKQTLKEEITTTNDVQVATLQPRSVDGEASRKRRR